jgi:hypothetical protein
VHTDCGPGQRAAPTVVKAVLAFLKKCGVQPTVEVFLRVKLPFQQLLRGTDQLTISLFIPPPFFPPGGDSEVTGGKDDDFPLRDAAPSPACSNTSTHGPGQQPLRNGFQG